MPATLCLQFAAKLCLHNHPAKYFTTHCFQRKLIKTPSLKNAPRRAILKGMNKKSLAHTNPHLKRTEQARKMRVRSIASSTAIETREPIKIIEAKLNNPKRANRRRVKLA